MHLQIVSPEATLFAGDVSVLTVPGINGEFQMLNNHAPIVSLLQEGNVRIKGSFDIPEAHAALFKNTGENEYSLEITGGTLEFKDNQAVILAN